MTSRPPSPPWDALGTALAVAWTHAGDNYAFGATAAGLAVCRVWRRPDLSSLDGARCATEMSELIQRAAGRAEITAQLFDAREAPVIAGPKTEEALGQMLHAWEVAKKPIVFVTSEDAMQRMQVRRWVERHAPKLGLTTSSFAEARAHVRA